MVVAKTPMGNSRNTPNPSTLYTDVEFLPDEQIEGRASRYTFDSYQDDAGTTAIYPDAGSESENAITYCIFGLIGEAGEIANKYKKVLRDNDGILTSAVKESIAKELGDVLWYCANLATELDVKLSEIAADNYTKLNDRQTRNVLRGSGDDR